MKKNIQPPVYSCSLLITRQTPKWQAIQRMRNIYTVSMKFTTRDNFHAGFKNVSFYKPGYSLVTANV